MIRIFLVQRQQGGTLKIKDDFLSLCVLVALACAAQYSGTVQASHLMSASKIEATDGKVVFDHKCEACHFDLSSEKKIGPGLAGLMKRAKFKNGMSADEYHLRRVIDRGGKDMPPFRGLLTEKQIRDLVAYVKTL